MTKEQLVSRALDALRLEEVVKETMEATMGMSLDNPMAMIPEDKKDEILTGINSIVQKHMSPEILRAEIYVPVYDSLYTKEELFDLIPILESKAYQDMLDKNLVSLPEVTKRTQAISEKMMPDMMTLMMEMMGAEEQLEEMANPKQN